MTGLLGGGHAIHFDAESGRARNLDFFVAVPGLEGDAARGRPARAGGPVRLGARPLRGRDRFVRSSGSATRPRSPLAGTRPAALAAPRRAGAPARPQRCADAISASVLPRNARARDDHERGRADLLARGRAPPGRGPPPAAGARGRARGDRRGGAAHLLLGDTWPALCSGSWRSEADWSPRRISMRTRPAGSRLSTSSSGASNAARGPGSQTFPAALARLPELRGLEEPERALALVGALLDELPAQTGTTNISVLDAEGNACVLTTSLGLGSGDFLPGYDLHLNSMLGEADLLVGDLEPGDRMASMMAPSLALDGDGVVARGRRSRRDALAQRAPAGRRGDPGRRPRASGRGRQAAPPPRRAARPHGAGLRPRDDGRPGVSRLRGPRVARPPPLFRRCQRGHAERRRGRSSEKRRGSSRVRLDASTQPTYPHSGHPGFARHGPAARRLRVRSAAGEAADGLDLRLPRARRDPASLSCGNRFRNLQKLALRSGDSALRAASTSRPICAISSLL